MISKSEFFLFIHAIAANEFGEFHCFLLAGEIFFTQKMSAIGGFPEGAPRKPTRLIICMPTQTDGRRWRPSRVPGDVWTSDLFASLGSSRFRRVIFGD
jgi:hypothetical protein